MSGHRIWFPITLGCLAVTLAPFALPPPVIDKIDVAPDPGGFKVTVSTRSALTGPELRIGSQPPIKLQPDAAGAWWGVVSNAPSDLLTVARPYVITSGSTESQPLVFPAKHEDSII